MSAVAEPASKPRLRVEEMEKSFFGVRVLEGVTFEAQPGEVLGIVGENGSGKSTTMNILAGVLQPDAGTMALDGRLYSPRNRREAEAAGISFIQQELNIFPNLSVAENLLLGRSPRVRTSWPIISRRKRHALAAELLEAVGLAVAPNASASILSSGERQLLEIARGLSIDARLMIFDEPTTSLSVREAERLFDLIGRLKARCVTILFVSHVLDDVLRLADRLLVMRDGNVTLTERRAGMTADRLIFAMIGRKIDALFPARTPGQGAAYEHRPMLELNGVSESGIVENIDLSVGAGEVVGISGLMGSGRSELARIIFGLDRHSRGSIRVDGVPLPTRNVKARLEAGVAFLTEDRRNEGLMMDASVAENITLAALPRFARRGDGFLRIESLRTTVAGLVRQLGVRSGEIESTPVRSLSGGNQQKVILGRWLLCEPLFLILDEPTRGIDVGAKEEIYRLLAMLAERGAGILIISSEIEELMGLCDRVVVMHRGSIKAGFARGEFDRQTILSAAFGQERVA